MRISFLISIALLINSLSFSQKNIEIVDSKKLIEKGLSYHNDMEYEKALEEYKQVVQNDTNYILAQYEKALTLNALERYEDCIAICKNFIANKNNDGNENEVYIYNLYGSTLDQLDKYEESIQVLDKGIKKYPHFTSLKVNKAITYTKAKQHEKSVAQFKKVLQDNPHYSNAHFQLGLRAANESKSTQALMSFVVGTIFSLSEKRLYFTDAYAEGKYDVEPTNTLLNEDKNADNFDEIDLIIQNKIALSKKFKTPTEFNFPIVSQLYAVLEQLEYNEDDKGFWMQYYVPYFTAVKEEDQFENMIYFLMGISKDEGLSRKASRYTANMKKFYIWHLNKWDELHGEATTTTQEGKKMKLMRHFYKQTFQAYGNENSDDEKEGYWEYYFNNGKLASYGYYENDKRIGTWHFFNKNGTKQSMFTYTKDKADGPYKKYDTHGILTQTGNYKNGNLDGKIKLYYKDGSVAEEYEYANNKIKGISKEYYTNGSLRYKIDHNQEGEINGEVISYYPSGEKKSEMNWKDGKKDGLETSYYVNGNISSTYNYKDGFYDGSYQSFYSNKQLAEEGNYTDGKKSGQSTMYYQNGSIKSKHNFDENGKENGIIEYYSPNKFKISEYNFVKDDLISYKHFNNSGEVIKEEKKKKNELNYEFISDNGQVKSKGLYKKGLSEGEWVYYEKNGSISSRVNYAKGKKNGITTNYFSNGEIKSEVPYKDGYINGVYKSYYADGTLASTGNYIDGDAQGYWNSFYRNGNIKSIHYYVNDKLNGYQEYFDIKGKRNDIFYYEDNTTIEKYTYDTLGNVVDTLNYNYGSINEDQMSSYGFVNRKGQFINDKAEGKHLFYEANNQVDVEAEYLLDKRHGAWKWYRNGNLTSESNYINGDLHGKSTSYFDDKIIKKESFYDYGYDVDVWKYYYNNGKLRRDMPHENNLRHGKSHYYSADGELQYIKIHDNGYFIGYTYNDKEGKLKEIIPIKNETVKLKAYFANGKVSAEVDIKNDRHNGTHKMYYANGQLQANIPHTNGYSNGKYQLFYSNGTLKEDGTYYYDEYHGKRTLYHSNGNKKQELTYIHGILFGKVSYYNELGKKIKEQEFYNNNILDEKTF